MTFKGPYQLKQFSDSCKFDVTESALFAQKEDAGGTPQHRHIMALVFFYLISQNHHANVEIRQFCWMLLFFIVE